MTPENQKFVKECADLAKRFNRLYQSDIGLVSVDSYHEGPIVHLSEECFLDLFGVSFEVAVRNDILYPFELMHMENGVKFFCITKRNPKRLADET